MRCGCSPSLGPSLVLRVVAYRFPTDPYRTGTVRYAHMLVPCSMLPVAGPGKGRRKIVCLEAFLAMPARAFSPLPPGGGGEGPGPPMLAQGCPDRATPLVGVTQGGRAAATGTVAREAAVRGGDGG